ncbi:hypothetical protein ABI59_16645 [Acidobacteria bacterium Mor1]|nr:hypothetical protein ABI59_16645 [Acidobacteria bacterium Mor1]
MLRTARAVALVLVAVIGAPAVSADPLAVCDEQVLGAPEALDGYRCYWLTGMRHNLRDAAWQRLEARRALRPEDPRPRLFLAALLVDRRQFEPALEHYAAALAGFEAEGNIDGRFWTLYGMSFALPPAEARDSLTHAEKLAADSEDRTLGQQAAVRRAWMLIDAGRIGDALLALPAADGSEMPAWLIARVAEARAAVAHHLGDYEAALAAYRVQLDALGGPEAAGTAGVQMNQALVVLRRWSRHGRHEEDPGAWLLAARDAARAEGRIDVEIRAQRLLVYRLPEEARRPQLERLLARAQQASLRGEQLHLHVALVGEWDQVDPDRARIHLEAAQNIAAEAGQPYLETVTRVVAAYLAFEQGEPAEIEQATRRLIDHVGRVRQMQRSHPTAPMVMSAYQRSGAWIPARLLEQDSGPAGLELAFAALEGLRDPISRDASIKTPSIDEVQERLAPDQALLVFHFAPRAHDDYSRKRLPDGSGWLIALTRERVQAYRLAPWQRLADQIGIYLGMIAGESPRSAAASRRLYDELLATAIDDLPQQVERLLVAPHGPLYGLPLATLQSADGTALIERFSLTTIPSAAAWIGGDAPAVDEPTTPSLLSLADPSPAGESVLSAWRLAGIQGRPPLGALPFAREEAAQFVAGLPGATALMGELASEAELKARLARDRVDLLHVAAHALVHETDPRRSSLVLAPGAPSQDGLMTYREITELELPGTVVVLTACRSAAGGPYLEGAGITGLADAFLRAGARQVVASLWPLQDEDAARLGSEFSRHLREGSDSATALARAQRRLRQAGFSERAWAGLVLIGDDAHAPFHGAQASIDGPGRRPLAVLLIALGGAGLLAVGWWYRRSR